MRERNEALDTFVYARAAASVAGLDRFEERHWAEMERQLKLLAPPEKQRSDPLPQEATHRGGLAASGVPRRGRQVIRSRWLR
jgi:phage terminase large subunit GpA-like protein